MTIELLSSEHFALFIKIVKVNVVILALYLAKIFFSSNTFPCPDKSKRDWVPKLSGGLPIIGHAFEYSQNTFTFIEKYRAKHGSCFSARM